MSTKKKAIQRRKPAPKRVVAIKNKPAVKKPISNKTAPAKVAATKKKIVIKKSAPKKKPLPKKAASKANTVVKKAVAKKTVPKKTVPKKKVVAKKPISKKVAVKKAATSRIKPQKAMVKEQSLHKAAIHEKVVDTRLRIETPQPETTEWIGTSAMKIMPCPDCGANAGELCISKETNKKIWESHPARIVAYTTSRLQSRLSPNIG
ncbi:MAG: hypothetical protein PHD65_01090 [Gallionella sp.]|nr:hypothetical protein [Gallionella sp.]